MPSAAAGSTTPAKPRRQRVDGGRAASTITACAAQSTA